MSVNKSAYEAAELAYWTHERSKINPYRVNVNDSIKAAIEAYEIACSEQPSEPDCLEGCQKHETCRKQYHQPDDCPPKCNRFVAENCEKFPDCCDRGHCRYELRSILECISKDTTYGSGQRNRDRAKEAIKLLPQIAPKRESVSQVGKDIAAWAWHELTKDDGFFATDKLAEKIDIAIDRKSAENLNKLGIELLRRIMMKTESASKFPDTCKVITPTDVYSIFEAIK